MVMCVKCQTIISL